MPTYAYRCADCGHAFDIHQAFTDDALTVCPECAGTLRKQFGSIGVTFKGSGFYRNDSRSGSKKSSGSSSGGSSSGTSSGGSSSSTSSTSGGSTGSSSGSQAASA
ncbi:FmdB family zinc ribbon protein [Isoptericola aurantiacus]|uniref:FmdB family zinc ribbon protein n=1 Tax=Isoptericola aurantiacus TaxID=3377839 RepID=UPI00383A24A8